MDWKDEIIRAFLLAFGMSETILNSAYLIKKEGLKFARKQHGELPGNLPDKNIRIKVICMLVSGITFLTVALASYLLRKELHQPIVIAASLFLVYGCTEALYYRHWKTTGFAIVTWIFFIAAIV